MMMQYNYEIAASTHKNACFKCSLAMTGNGKFRGDPSGAEPFNNEQIGVTGTVSSTSTIASLTSYSGSGVATASDSGVTTAPVSRVIQPGYYRESPIERLDLRENSYYSIALTNDFAYSIDFTYDYLIDPSYIELAYNAVGSDATNRLSISGFGITPTVSAVPLPSLAIREKF